MTSKNQRRELFAEHILAGLIFFIICAVLVVVLFKCEMSNDLTLIVSGLTLISYEGCMICAFDTIIIYWRCTKTSYIKKRHKIMDMVKEVFLVVKNVLMLCIELTVLSAYVALAAYAFFVILPECQGYSEISLFIGILVASSLFLCLIVVSTEQEYRNAKEDNEECSDDDDEYDEEYDDEEYDEDDDDDDEEYDDEEYDEGDDDDDEYDEDDVEEDDSEKDAYPKIISIRPYLKKQHRKK